VVFVDDSVSACSRARVDAEDFHGQRLGAGPDNPLPGRGRVPSYAAEIVKTRFSEVACPNPSVAVIFSVYVPARA
jgi:hypothetical protein